MTEWPRNLLDSRDEDVAALEAEIARLTAELADHEKTIAANAELIREQIAELAGATERERVLRDELSEAKAMLDYHVDKPVDTRDAVRKLGQHLANMCDEDQWPGVERLLNGLRETLRKRGVLGEP